MNRSVGIAVAIAIGLAAALVVRPRRTDGPRAASAGMTGMTRMPMDGNGGIYLTADRIRQFGVTFGSVEVRPLTSDIRAGGTVVVDERRVSQITPHVGGYIERLYVNATGQAVHRGQPLAAIYSPELVAAQEELVLASRLGRAGATIPGLPRDSADLVAAARRRLTLWEISDAQIDEVLRTGRPRRTLTLYAPVSGIVTDKRVVEGQAIEAGVPLYTVADLSRVWIEMTLRESQAADVKTGALVTVDLAAYPGRGITGRVEYIYPTLDSTARAVRARVAIPNPGGRIMPGMYATAHVVTAGRSALTVPTSAVLRTGEEELTFVDTGDGRLMPRSVEVGRTAGAYTEVLSGLAPGQRVVTSAQFLLDAEANLSEVMKRMVAQMNMSDMNPPSMGSMTKAKSITGTPRTGTPVSAGRR